MSHLQRLRPRRVALLKPSALGDIVHSLPVLHALRCRFPAAHITWVVNRSYASLLAGHPELDDVLAFDRRGGIVAALQLTRELFRRRFDLVVDLQGLLRTGVMAAATLAPRRVGMSDAREGARFAYTDVVHVSREQHAVDRYWRVAEALGAGDMPKRFVVPIPDDAAAWAARELRGRPRPWLAVAVGARWVTKRWLVGHFRELIQKFGQAFGGTAVFVGGPEDVGISCEAASGSGVDLTGKTTLPQLAAVLSRMDAMLSNDTGPAHLAAAPGRPVVAPYTCTKVRLHGPYRQTGGVESAVDCQGSYLKQCPHMTCMTELTPERVWPVLHEVLTRWDSRYRSA